MITEADLPDFSNLDEKTRKVLADLKLDVPKPVSVYTNCFSNVIETDAFAKNSPDLAATLKDFKEKGFGFLKEVEETYSCGGFCNDALYYVTQDIEKGLPTKDCIKELVGGLIDSAIAFTAFGGVLLLISWLLSLPIICGIPDDDVEDTN